MNVKHIVAAVTGSVAVAGTLAMAAVPAMASETSATFEVVGAVPLVADPKNEDSRRGSVEPSTRRYDAVCYTTGYETQGTTYWIKSDTLEGYVAMSAAIRAIGNPPPCAS
ncbi:hypothetical protein LG634_07785 [Streptomyces bambusae]|uniref:hypothetical protein n=1 Tax=Streptomyces bambusae TaxID=1550616 RepID=UPI001CFE314E|nr:hypothetical protein [Streptomyces bambusae]MCB5164735.1 hypothetical protein [Streptomyces bambusae]